MGAGQNPWRSVLLVGAVAVLVSGLAPFGMAIAVSSFGTLLYYTVTNLSALRLSREQRMFPRALAVAGLVGCVALAFSLAPLDIAIGLAILACGVGYRLLRFALVQEAKGRP